MLLQRGFLFGGDDDGVIYACFGSFLDHILNRRAIQDRQQLLGHGLGGRGHARARPGWGGGRLAVPRAGGGEEVFANVILNLWWGFSPATPCQAKAGPTKLSRV